MDRENELILSGIGACPYCGQAVAVDRREGGPDCLTAVYLRCII